MKLKSLYAEISKSEKQSDGTLIVHGIASSEAVDSDGEIIKASAMREAIPAFLLAPSIREMHQPIAAGRATAMHVDDQGRTHITAHIVDAGSVKKVEENVLRGFSIQGPVQRDPTNRKTITKIKLREISLVDTGANPDATISSIIYKTAKGDPGCSCAIEHDGECESAVVDEAAKAAEIAKAAKAKADADAALKAAESAVVAKAAQARADAIDLHVHLAAAGFCPSAATAGEVAKVQGERDTITKKLADAEAAKAEAIAKVATLEIEKSAAVEAMSKAGETIEKMIAERSDLAKKLNAANVELARKGVLRIVPISKEDEAAKAAAAADDEKNAPPLGTPERALHEIKKAQASGGRPLNPTA